MNDTSISIVVPQGETSQWSVAGEPTGNVPVEPQGTDERESMEMAYCLKNPAETAGKPALLTRDLAPGEERVQLSAALEREA